MRDEVLRLAVLHLQASSDAPAVSSYQQRAHQRCWFARSSTGKSADAGRRRTTSRSSSFSSSHARNLPASQRGHWSLCLFVVSNCIKVGVALCASSVWGIKTLTQSTRRTLRKPLCDKFGGRSVPGVVATGWTPPTHPTCIVRHGRTPSLPLRVLTSGLARSLAAPGTDSASRTRSVSWCVLHITTPSTNPA